MASGLRPLNSVALSTLFAALPLVVLLGTLAIFRIKAHRAAILGLITSLVAAIGIFGMPHTLPRSGSPFDYRNILHADDDESLPCPRRC